MNAYELADEIDKYWQIWKQSIPIFDNATNMLRQQADMEQYFAKHAPMEYQAFLNEKGLK